MAEGIIKEVTLKFNGVYKDNPVEIIDTWFSRGEIDKDLGIISFTDFALYLPDERISGTNYYAEGSIPIVYMKFNEILDFNVSIFPKTWLQKLFRFNHSKENLSYNFKLMAPGKIVDSLNSNSVIHSIMSDRQLFVSTKEIANENFIVLKPNESICSEDQLTELVVLMKELGQIIAPALL